MYEVTYEQMSKIRAVLDKGLCEQKRVFDALDFNPSYYGSGLFDSVVMERERYENERQERIENPIDYGVCETDDREAEIKAGAVLSPEEERAVNEGIFDHDDTLMVTTELSSSEDKLLVVTVQQIWGQGGLHVINFLGFFEKIESARRAIERADYVTFGDK